MFRKLILSLFMLAFGILQAQDCNISRELLNISELNEKGAFKEGLLKVEKLLKCTELNEKDKISVYVLEYKLQRNRLKHKKALASLQKAFMLQEQLGIQPNLDFNLLLAESYGLNNQANKLNELLITIEEEILQVKDSIFLGRYYYVKQFSIDRALFSVQHLNFIHKSLDYFNEVNPQSIYYKGNLLRALGNGARTSGDFDKSISFYTQELEVWRTLYPQEHFNFSICNYNIGNVFYEKLEYQKALNHYLEAHKIWETVFKPESHRMRSLNEAIGDMYWELQNPKKALEYFNYAIAHEIGINNDTSEITLTLADSLLEKGNYAAAINYYDEAVKWREKTYGKNHMLTGACKNFVARALKSSGDKSASLNTYQEAITILVNGFEDTSWFSNPELSMDIQSHQYLLESLIAKGNLLKELYEEKKNISYLEIAWETQKLAIQLLGEIKNNEMSEGSKMFWTSKTISLMESAIDTAHKLYMKNEQKSYVEEAFYISEQSKSFLLLASLYDQDITEFANIPKEIIEQEQRIKSQINEYAGRIEIEEKRCADVREKMMSLYTNKLHELQYEHTALINTIKQDYPNYYHLKYDTEIPIIGDVQKTLLDASKNLVNYFIGIDNTYIFYVTQNSISMRVLENSKNLNTEVELYFQLLSVPTENKENKENKNYIQVAHKLYEKLLAPELKNSDTKQLIIIPDGYLAYIPFEAFITESLSKENIQFRKLPYLIKDVAISYSPSASVAMHFYSNNTSNNTSNIDYYGFAPDYENNVVNEFRKKQSNLQFNKSEVEFASSLFKGKSWTGNQVTENLLKQYSKNAGILHLAMHGEVEDEHPLLSKLYFNKSEDEDGLLYIYEVYNLSIPAQLVILSACNTASGVLQKGEGILSLERAFQYSGSKSLMTTFWSVDDQASSQIIQEFLMHLKDGKSKDEALKLAKLSFIKTANPEQLHPFFWSSFKLTGNSNPLQKNKYKMVAILGGSLVLLAFFGWAVQRRKRRLSL